MKSKSIPISEAKKLAEADPDMAEYIREMYFCSMFEKDIVTQKEIRDNLENVWREYGDKVTDSRSFLGKIKFYFNLTTGHPLNDNEIFYFERADGGTASGSFYMIRNAKIREG